jgi:hydroxymethylbilane synthase
MPDFVRIATRSSSLAMIQAREVGEALGRPYELVEISTRGDHAAGPLTEIGGKGLFTAELEDALRRGEVGLAVHSAKDLPIDLPEDMAIAAVGRREDPRDALVSAGGEGLAELPQAARVGTSSLRRAAQACAARGDVQILPLRGNVQTRLAKLDRGDFDAVVLAMAGLKRLAVADELAGKLWPLPVEQFVPAAGQGALAVECLASNAEARELASAVNDPDSAAALAAERAVVAALGASCRSALGVYIRPGANTWRGIAMAAPSDGGKILRLAAETPTAEQVAGELIRQLHQAGAAKMLES